MILDAACAHFSLTSNWKMSQYLPDTIAIKDFTTQSDLGFWQSLFSQHHDIWQDHLALSDSRNLSNREFVQHFESLRKVYEKRFEYERYRLPTTPNKKAAEIARRLLFK
jgi:ATP-dependent exoDNAse (exonuclease V) beta subunit